MEYRAPTAAVIRPMHYRDMETVCCLDNKCFHWAWNLQFWKKQLYEVRVIEYEFDVQGFIVYTLNPYHVGMINPDLFVIKIGVNPACRGKGLGARLMNCVNASAHMAAVRGITVQVPERTDLNTLQWLRRHGYNATGVLADCFNIFGESEDGYVFRKVIL